MRRAWVRGFALALFACLGLGASPALGNAFPVLVASPAVSVSASLPVRRELREDEAVDAQPQTDNAFPVLVASPSVSVSASLPLRPANATLRRMLREEDAADARPQTGGAADRSPAPAPADDGDNPLKAPARPALHRVYDPLSGLTCDVVGDCLPCPVTEQDEAFCRDTGFRQELNCPAQGGGDAATAHGQREARFRACVPHERPVPIYDVFKFEVRTTTVRVTRRV